MDGELNNAYIKTACAVNDEKHQQKYYNNNNNNNNINNVSL